MFSIIAGALTISLFHAIIPNHWLPVLAIGRKEGWSLAETSRITFIAGLSHVISTIIIGILLGMIGGELAQHLDSFTRVIAPAILVLLGLYFIRQHYEHRHFHLQKEKLEKKTKRSIITALVIAMFLSPCMEIEAYFLLAGTRGWHMMALIALMYSVITITGMLIWVRIVYKGLLKLNWHKWEHNAGIFTGLTLVATGVISFFIQ
ncbi:MAG: cytochrome c biogenesis protein CcdA [Chitinophagaceae bacterium]|jgi:putative Mn2+ efflux pump MntP